MSSKLVIINNMKKIRVILPAIFLFIVSCAKPYVTERSYPEDKNLNCEELELAVFEAEVVLFHLMLCQV